MLVRTNFRFLSRHPSQERNLLPKFSLKFPLGCVANKIFTVVSKLPQNFPGVGVFCDSRWNWETATIRQQASVMFFRSLNRNYFVFVISSIPVLGPFSEKFVSVFLVRKIVMHRI